MHTVLYARKEFSQNPLNCACQNVHIHVEYDFAASFSWWRDFDNKS